MTDIRKPNNWQAGDLAYRWRESRNAAQFGDIGSINPVVSATRFSLNFQGQRVPAAVENLARVLTPAEVARLPAGAKVAVLRGWRNYKRGDVIELARDDAHWCALRGQLGGAIRAAEMLLALIELPPSEDKIRAEKVKAAGRRIEAAEAELEQARKELEDLA